MFCAAMQTNCARPLCLKNRHSHFSNFPSVQSEEIEKTLEIRSDVEPFTQKMVEAK